MSATPEVLTTFPIRTPASASVHQTQFDLWSGEREERGANQGRGRGMHAHREVRRVFAEGLRHHLAGRIEAAVARYQRALVMNPDYTDALNNLAAALAAQGRWDEAISMYRRALSIKPESADTQNNLGNALAAVGRVADAVARYQRALAIHPGHAGAHYNLAIAREAQGRIADAIEHYRCATLLKPDHADAHNNLANALMKQGSPNEALQHYRRVLALNPNHVEAHNNIGNLYRERGQFEDALMHYGWAINGQPDHAEAHFHRAQIRTFARGDRDLAELESLAASASLPTTKAPYIHFALAKALEDTGDYHRSFAHLRLGNELKRSMIQYDEAGTERLFARIQTVFGRSLFERLSGHGDQSHTPVFVLGMPRSGSTLIEQILASHPMIHAAGELPNLKLALGRLVLPFPDCAHDFDAATIRQIGKAYLAGLPPAASGQVRIVDKLPDNFLRIGLIRLVFPNARLIHTTRNPIDTCVSCYSNLFTTGQHFSYEMGELGRHYRRYAALMDHWRSVLPADAILDVAYEDVVGDIEGAARRMIEYCGLPWDDRCLAFHQTTRPVKTASAVQVRKPLFRSSVERWRRYEAGIGPLIEALGEPVNTHLRAAS